MLCAVILALAVAAYTYGIPLASRVILAAVPLSVDRAIGDVFFESMDGTTLTPSQLDTRRRPGSARRSRAPCRAPTAGRCRRRRWSFDQATSAPTPSRCPAAASSITDELVSLVGAREDVVVGVLAHEYGHVKARHGVRMVAQSALLRTATSLLLGDFSAVMAAAPALLGEQAYSRDFERDADAESVRVMKAAGLSPAAMVSFFEKLAEKDLGSGSGIAIAFASHPADAERVDFFRRAAEAP